MARLYSPTHAGPPPCISRLQWNKCDTPALEKMSSPIDTAVHGDTAYFRPYRSEKIYSYNLTSGWSDWADCLVRDCSLVVLPVPYGGTVHSLHTIGGIKRKNHQQNDDEEEDEEEFTADISQLINSAPGEWTPSIYPTLRTKRSQVTVVFNGCLIVAGGNSAHGIIQTVDVLIVTDQNKLSWHEVASLPYKVFRASGCVCDGELYLLGGYVVRDGDIVPTRNACVATVSELVKSHTDDKIFKKIRNLEFKTSACVSFRNHVLAIGGWKFNTETGQQKGTKLVYVYHTRADAWKKLEGQLPRPRCLGFAAAFKDKIIMTVGGYNRPRGICTDSVAFATIPSDEPKQVCQALLLPSDTDPQASCQRKRSSLASDAHGSSPENSHRTVGIAKRPFSNPIVLTGEDILIICENLKNASKDWFNLGLVFGIKFPDVKNIQDQCSDNNRRLTEMVGKRLEATDPEHPMTWPYICECLRNPLVERNDVAEEIERCMRSGS